MRSRDPRAGTLVVFAKFGVAAQGDAWASLTAAAGLAGGVSARVPPAAPDQPIRSQTVRAPPGGEFRFRDGETASLYYRVQFVRLEPGPVGEQPVLLPHYVAPLMVSAPQSGSRNWLGIIAH